MNKEQCVDRSGNSHFGEFGWMDGYQCTLCNCRVQLEARGNCCENVDECVEECMKRISHGKTTTNIISQNIQNMKDGEKTKQLEEKEDREMQALRREEEKARTASDKEEKELGGKKVKVVESNSSEETWICPHCEKEIGEKELYQDKEGKWYHRPCIGKGPIILPEKKEIEEPVEEVKEETSVISPEEEKN